MIAEPNFPERLSEVRRLTDALIDQMLEAQILWRPVPQKQSEALIKAAVFLRDCNLPWWPMLAQALHGLDRKADMALPDAPADDAMLDNIDSQGLTRFLTAFWKEKAQQ